MDGGNQPEFVAAKIENRQHPHQTNAAKRVFQIGEGAELVRFSQTIPILEPLGAMTKTAFCAR